MSTLDASLERQGTYAGSHHAWFRPRDIFRRLDTLRRRGAAKRRTRRDMQALLRLEDPYLEDMGLTRSQVLAELGQAAVRRAVSAIRAR